MLTVEQYVIRAVEELCIEYQVKENFPKYVDQTLSALETNEAIAPSHLVTKGINQEKVRTYLANLEDMIYLEIRELRG